MSIVETTVALTNFIFIGLLPVIFFRRDGGLNLMWWATASPFFIAALIVLAAAVGSLKPALLVPNGLAALQQIIGVVVHLFSIALIAYTLGTHRRAIALWHQDNDAPQNIVTEGAYRLARHPFYTAFLMAFFATCVLFPHALTLLLFVYAVFILTFTARREERRLLASEFGEEYAAYMQSTGRFWP